MAVGQEVTRSAADTVTPVTLEQGGKNPFVVFPGVGRECAQIAIEEYTRTKSVNVALNDPEL